MIKKTLFVLILISAALVQCKSKEAASASNETVSNISENTETPELRSITIDREYRFAETDAFKIQSMNITDNILTLEVTYSGGCEEHSFEMVSNEMIKKSLPPKHTLYLEHESNNDACRALITEKLFFNLENVRLGGSGTVIFNINNEKESIAYSFEKEQRD